MKLSDTIERKFIEAVDCSEYEILTDTGFEQCGNLLKTIEYDEYEIVTKLGNTITVADTHIFFDTNYNEIFAEDCLGVKLSTSYGEDEVISVKRNGKSSHMFDIEVHSDNHRYYTNDILSHNSITSVAWLLHYVIFNDEKKVAILANKGSIAREMLARLTLMLENLPFFLQPGCKVLNKGNIMFSNNSEVIAAATSSSSVRGMSLNVVMLDEFAFVQNAATFFTSTYPVITSGQETKVIITSTPNGVGNMFYKLWEGATQKTNDFKPFTIKWWEVPGRDEAWKAQTIANTSEQQFAQEFEVNFLGSSETLIAADTLLSLKSIEPKITQYDIKYYKESVEDHEYILVADTGKGRGRDYSAFSVIDISTQPFEQVASYRNNLVSPLLYPEYILRAAKTYNEAMVIAENNDSGEVVCNALYYDYEYENVFTTSSVKSDGIGLRMTKKVKRIGCSNLKDLIESGKLQLNDADTIMELSSFAPKGDSFAAQGNAHDDTVMPLVMFGYFVGSEMFTTMTSTELKNLLYEEKIKQIDEDLPPFGFIVNNNSSSTSPSEAIYARMRAEAEEWGGL